MRDLVEILLKEILPSSIAQDKQVASGSIALDPELQAVTLDTRETYILSRLDELPEPVLDLLAWQFHVDFYEPTTLSVEAKRRLVRSSIPWHRKKGTIWAIRQILADLDVKDVSIREWWELGENATPYTFAIEGHFKGDPDETASFLGPDTNKLLWHAVEVTKPVRSWIKYIVVVPEPPDIPPDHICKWDVCHWSHGWTKTFSLNIDGFAAGLDPTISFVGVVGSFHAGVYERSLKWDVGNWDSLIECGQKHCGHVFEAQEVRRFEGNGTWGEVSWDEAGTWNNDGFTEIYWRVIPKSLAVWGWSDWDGEAHMAPRERIVPDMGRLDQDKWSGKKIPGAHYKPILEYTTKKDHEVFERQGEVIFFDGVLPCSFMTISVPCPTVTSRHSLVGRNLAQRYKGYRKWCGGWNDSSWQEENKEHCYVDIFLMEAQ